MPGLFREFVIIFLLVLGGTAYTVFSGNVPETSALAPVSEPGIPVVEAIGMDPVWIDARKAEDFANGHIPGAVNLNDNLWDEGIFDLLEVWEPGRPIVVYCYDDGCETSSVVAAQLRADLGSEAIFVLSGGWDAWTHYSSNGF